MVMQPFAGEIIKNVLGFFLLDMGLSTASHLKDLKKIPKLLIVYGVVAPVVHASLALWVSIYFGCRLGMPLCWRFLREVDLISPSQLFCSMPFLRPRHLLIWDYLSA